MRELGELEAFLTAAEVDASVFALSTNGVTGRPSEATPELGSALLERVAGAVAEQVERGRFEESPLAQAAVPAISRSTFP